MYCSEGVHTGDGAIWPCAVTPALELSHFLQYRAVICLRPNDHLPYSPRVPMHLLRPHVCRKASA